jgi:hypothetical protein
VVEGPCADARTPLVHVAQSSKLDESERPWNFLQGAKVWEGVSERGEREGSVRGVSEWGQ